MRILISGSSSGLGKYLFENFAAIPWTRNISDADKKNLRLKGVDIIIHCAFNSNKSVNSDNLYQYLTDNVLLTKELLNIPHQKFIFISSVDVYPKDHNLHTEDEIIDISRVEEIYQVIKLMSESLIKNLSSNYLILRCTTLVGKYSRKNSLIKIIEEENPTVTLSSDSSLNCLLYEDVFGFIKLGIKENLQGIYNLASSENITISQLAKFFKKKVHFGSFTYNVGNITNSKAVNKFFRFKKTSHEIIAEFIKN